jgi:hypothetical protein
MDSQNHLELVGSMQGLVDVLGNHTGRQTKRRVVGLGDGVLSKVAQHAQESSNKKGKVVDSP